MPFSAEADRFTLAPPFIPDMVSDLREKGFFTKNRVIANLQTELRFEFDTIPITPDDPLKMFAGIVKSLKISETDSSFCMDPPQQLIDISVNEESGEYNHRLRIRFDENERVIGATIIIQDKTVRKVMWESNNKAEPHVAKVECAAVQEASDPFTIQGLVKRFFMSHKGKIASSVVYKKVINGHLLSHPMENCPLQICQRRDDNTTIYRLMDKNMVIGMAPYLEVGAQEIRKKNSDFSLYLDDTTITSLVETLVTSGSTVIERYARIIGCTPQNLPKSEEFRIEVEGKGKGNINDLCPDLADQIEEKLRDMGLTVKIVGGNDTVILQPGGGLLFYHEKYDPKAALS